MNFFRSLPGANYVAARDWLHSKHFKRVADVITATPAQLTLHTMGMTEKRAEQLVAFFRHNFDADMVGRV
jgi:hypothetical protein